MKWFHCLKIDTLCNVIINIMSCVIMCEVISAKNLLCFASHEIYIVHFIFNEINVIFILRIEL